MRAVKSSARPSTPIHGLAARSKSPAARASAWRRSRRHARSRQPKTASRRPSQRAAAATVASCSTWPARALAAAVVPVQRLLQRGEQAAAQRLRPPVADQLGPAGDGHPGGGAGVGARAAAPPRVDGAVLRKFAPIAALHAGGHALQVAAMGAGSVYFTTVIKATEAAHRHARRARVHGQDRRGGSTSRSRRSSAASRTPPMEARRRRVPAALVRRARRRSCRPSSSRWRLLADARS